MAVPRAKKSKRKPQPHKTDLQVVTQANHMTYALTLRVLKDFGWGKVRFERFADKYLEYATYYSDNGYDLLSVIVDGKKRTGIDVTGYLDGIYRWTSNLIRNSDRYALSIVLMILRDNGFGKKRLAEFLESYKALAEECTDGRNSINGAIRDSDWATGVNSRAALDGAIC